MLMLQSVATEEMMSTPPNGVWDKRKRLTTPLEQNRLIDGNIIDQRDQDRAQCLRVMKGVYLSYSTRK